MRPIVTSLRSLLPRLVAVPVWIRQWQYWSFRRCRCFWGQRGRYKRWPRGSRRRGWRSCCRTPAATGRLARCRRVPESGPVPKLVRITQTKTSQEENWGNSFFKFVCSCSFHLFAKIDGRAGTYWKPFNPTNFFVSDSILPPNTREEKKYFDVAGIEPEPYA